MIEKSKITTVGLEMTFAALLAGSPVSAARYGLLTLTHSAAGYSAARLEEVLAPLCAELGVPAFTDVPAALAAFPGRVPWRISARLRSRPIVEALADAYDELSLYRHSDRVRGWLTADLEPDDLRCIGGEDRGRRQDLTDQLMARVAEIMDGWRGIRTRFSDKKAPSVDGRALVAAARAWQVRELSPRSMVDAPTSAAARYPNRLGRTAAAVAASRLGPAFRSPMWVPPIALTEALALLIAVAESVHCRGQTGIAVSVKLGSPVGEGLSGSMGAWWPVLDSWGSMSRAVAASIGTAWRLSVEEGDVLVWALCSAACRLAVAAAVADDSSRLSLAEADGAWAAHVREAMPPWEGGAEAVWTLMQQTRPVDSRSMWPGCVMPSVDDQSTWPWRPFPGQSEAGTLGTVPVEYHVEGS